MDHTLRDAALGAAPQGEVRTPLQHGWCSGDHSRRWAPLPQSGRNAGQDHARPQGRVV